MTASELEDPAISRILVGVLSFRLLGPLGVVLLNRGIALGPPLPPPVLVLVGFGVLVSVLGLVLVRRAPGRAWILRPAVARVDIALIAAACLVNAALMPPGTYGIIWSDPTSLALNAACMFWSFVHGGKWILGLGAMALVVHAGTGLANGYGAGWPASWHVVDRMTWVTLGLVAATVVQRPLVAAHRMRTAQQAMAQEQARILDRLHHYDSMHGTVLRVLDGIARGDEIDAGVRADAARQGLWLRSLIRGEAPDDDQGVNGAVARVVDTRRALGMRVRLLQDPGAGELPPDVVAAISVAVGEALDNVRRHAGTDAAHVLIAREGGDVVVSVSDRGRGFVVEEVLSRSTRYGVRHVLVESVERLGGSVGIVSVPSQGTTVEWRFPVRTEALSP